MNSRLWSHRPFLHQLSLPVPDAGNQLKAAEAHHFPQTRLQFLHLYCDGTAFAHDGTVFGHDGTESGPDGTAFGHDGTALDRDGTAFDSDGTVDGKLMIVNFVTRTLIVTIAVDSDWLKYDSQSWTIVIDSAG